MFCFNVTSLMLQWQILDQLVPEEEADLSDLVLEVTAGVGGQEAMLFTAEVQNTVVLCMNKRDGNKKKQIVAKLSFLFHFEGV